MGISSVPYVGRLPGDVYVHRGNFSFYFPLATCILISIIATILLFADEALTNWQPKNP